jgi:hypothetical protein
MFQVPQAQNPSNQIGGTNPIVLGQGSSEEKGEMARMSVFIGAIAVSDLVKTTMGPKGMVKYKKFIIRIKSFNQ